MSITDNLIYPSELVGKGNVGMPDTPNLTTAQMQAKLDELALEVIIPKYNALIEYLYSISDLDNIIHTNNITNIRKNNDILQISIDNGDTWIDCIKYDSLANKPTIDNITITGDLSTTEDFGLVKAESLADVALSGDYTDLENTPTIPNDIEDLADVEVTEPQNGQVLAYVSDTGKWVNTEGGGGGGGGGVTDYQLLNNKPKINGEMLLGDKQAGDFGLVNKDDLADVATTGSYNDLSYKPDLFEQLPEWNFETSYTAKQMVQKNNTAYKALVDNVNQDPETATEYWGVVNIVTISNSLPFSLAIDMTYPRNPVYGYLKEGADTVTPFRNPTGDATVADVIKDKVFSNANEEDLVGALTNSNDVIANSMTTKNIFALSSRAMQPTAGASKKSCTASTVSSNGEDFFADIPIVRIAGNTGKSYNEGTYLNYISQGFPYQIQDKASLRLPGFARSIKSMIGGKTSGNLATRTDGFGRYYIGQGGKFYGFSLNIASSDQQIAHEGAVINTMQANYNEGVNGNLLFQVKVYSTGLKCGVYLNGLGGSLIENSTKLLTPVAGQPVDVGVYILTPYEILLMYNTYSTAGIRQVISANRASINPQTGAITYGTAVGLCAANSTTVESGFCIARSMLWDFRFSLYRFDTTLSTGNTVYYERGLVCDPRTAGNIAVGGSSWTNRGDTNTYDFNIQLNQVAYKASDAVAIADFFAYLERRKKSDGVYDAFCNYEDAIETVTPVPIMDTTGWRWTSFITAFDRSTGIALMSCLAYDSTVEQTASKCKTYPCIWSNALKKFIFIEAGNFKRSYTDIFSIPMFTQIQQTPTGYEPKVYVANALSQYQLDVFIRDTFKFDY